MIVRKDGRDLFIATGEGLIEVTASRVAILTDSPFRPTALTRRKAEEARNAPKPVSAKNSRTNQVASVNAALTRSLVSCASSDGDACNMFAAAIPANNLRSAHVKFGDYRER